MTTFEIIVKNDKEAIRVELPNRVINKIMEISTLKKENPKISDNEIIMRMCIKALYRIL